LKWRPGLTFDGIAHHLEIRWVCSATPLVIADTCWSWRLIGRFSGRLKPSGLGRVGICHRMSAAAGCVVAAGRQLGLLARLRMGAEAWGRLASSVACLVLRQYSIAIGGYGPIEVAVSC
jgi:hypothetical protein